MGGKTNNKPTQHASSTKNRRKAAEADADASADDNDTVPQQQQEDAESSQDSDPPARVTLDREATEKAVVRHSLTNRFVVTWLLRPTDPAGNDLWPAVIDFIMALHDVLTLNESSQAEFSKLGASVGTLAEMVLLELMRDTKKTDKWPARFIEVLNVFKSAAPMADGMEPHELLRVFTDALLEHFLEELRPIPPLNPRLTLYNPLEAVCIVAGIVKQAKGNEATIKDVHTYVHRVAKAFEPIRGGSTTALHTGFAIACSNGLLFDRLGVTNDADRREITFAANELIADLSDDERTAAWSKLRRTIDMRVTTKIGIATPAGPAFGTMAVSSARAAVPVAAVMPAAAPSPAQCTFCGRTGHSIAECRTAIKVARERERESKRKRDDKSKTEKKGDKHQFVRNNATSSDYTVGSTFSSASAPTQCAASISVTVQALDDAGEPTQSVDVGALADTGSNDNYINEPTWIALGRPPLVDADDQDAPLHDVNGGPVRARRLAGPIHIAVRNANMGFTADDVRLLPDMPVAALIGRKLLLDPSAHAPTPAPDASGETDLLRFRWVTERQAIQMALSNGNWFDVGTQTPSLVAAAAPLHLSDPHAATAGMRAVAQAGAKALREQSAAPPAPQPAPPLDIPELTYETDTKYRREFHEKHAGDHRLIELPADIPADVAAQLRRTFAKHATVFASKGDPPPISKIAPLDAQVDPARLDRAVALACKHMPRLGERDAKVVEDERNTLVKAGRLTRCGQPPICPGFVFVVYQNDKPRCVTVTPINAASRQHGVPLQSCDEALQELAKFKYFATIDLLGAFFQIPVSEGLQPYLASRFNREAYWLRTAPMGFVGSPAHLAHFTARACNTSSDEGMSTAVADDVLIGAESQRARADIIDRVCSNMAEWAVTANVGKVKLSTLGVDFPAVGALISHGVIKLPYTKLEAITECGPISSMTALRTFLGLIVATAGHLPEVRMNADVLALQGLTGKYMRFARTPELDQTVERIKDVVRKCEPAVFHTIRGGEPLFIFTDAQPAAAAAMLYQLPPPGETLLRLNAFIVHKFGAAELRRAIFAKELSTLRLALRKLRLRIKGGGTLFCVTDNEGGALLVRFPRLADDQSDFVRSVAAEISETPLIILVISGPDNTVADAACRFATMASGTEPDEAELYEAARAELVRIDKRSALQQVLEHPKFAGSRSLSDMQAGDIVAAIAEQGGTGAGISVLSNTQYAAYLNDVASFVDAARADSSGNMVAPVLADYELPRALPRPRAAPTAGPPQAAQHAEHAARPPPPPQTQAAAAPAHVAQQAPPQVHPTPPQPPGPQQPAQPQAQPGADGLAVVLGMKPNEVLDKQLEDPDLRKFTARQIAPGDEQQISADIRLKRDADGVYLLARRVEKADGTRTWSKWLLLVPNGMRQPVAEALHRAYGHIGPARLKQLAQDVVVWPGMFAHLAATAKACLVCAARNPAPATRNVGSFNDDDAYRTAKPGDILQIDAWYDGNGNMAITVVDHASRYVVAFPVPSINNVEVRRAIELTAQFFGYHSKIIVDPGPENRNKPLADFLAQTGVDVVIVKQGAHVALVERVHRMYNELLRKLRDIVSGEQREQLPFPTEMRIVTNVINTTPRADGASPLSSAQLMFGRQIATDAGAFLSPGTLKLFATPAVGDDADDKNFRTWATNSSLFQRLFVHAVRDQMAPSDPDALDQIPADVREAEIAKIHDARDKRRTQDVPGATHTQFRPGMLVAIDKAIDADSGKLGAGLALPFRIVSVKDVTACVEFVAPSLTAHPLRFDVNVRQLRPLPTIGQIDSIAPSVDESKYMIQNFLASPDAIGSPTVNSMQQLDFVLNGLMPAKWRDRIVKFLKKHIQLAQEQARQDTAVRERTLLENQRLEAAIQREKAAASFSATLAAAAADREERGKATKKLMELVNEEAKRNEPHKADELHVVTHVLRHLQVVVGSTQDGQQIEKAFAHLNARERQLKNEWVEQIGRGTGASATVPSSGGV
jgi:hypothetical protein